MDRRLFEGLTFKVAAGEECRSALELRDEVYTSDLGHVPIDGRDDAATHLVAVDADRRVVAAFRVVEERPFDFERFVSIDDLIGDGRNPALIGRLCVRPEHRSVRRSSFLLMGMLKLAHAYAERRSISDFFLYTYPNLIKFYRGAFFDLLGVTVPHPDWGEVHLMRMDVLALERRCATSRSAVARLLLDREMPNFVV